MQVTEAKEIIKSMEMSEVSRETLEKMLEGMGDSDELSNELLDRILAVIDSEIDNAKIEADTVDESIILDLEKKPEETVNTSEDQ